MNEQKPRIAMLLLVMLQFLVVEHVFARVLVTPGYDSEQGILDLANAQSGQNLAVITEYVEDLAGDLSINELGDLAWQQAREDLSFGYTNSVYWFRFKITNSGQRHLSRLLSISYPVIDYIDLYRRTDAGHWQLTSLGDKLEFDDRLLPHRHFLVPFEVDPDEVQEWVFRVETSSSMQFPMTLWDERDFFVHDQNQILGLGLYYGIMLIMVFYNLFVFFSVKEGNYLFYVLYVACTAGFLGSLQGINFQYLWPSATHWNDQSIIVLLSGVIIFAGIFTRKFLYLHKDPSFFNRLIGFLIIVCIGIVFMSNLVAYHTLIRVLIVVAMLAMVGAIVLGIRRWAEGFMAARYYTIAWTSFLLGGIVLALNKFNIVPRNFFTENALQIGSAMEVILLSFALADRLNQEKRERYEAQISALEHEKLARRAQTEALDQERNARKAQEKALEHERAAREAQTKALDIQKRATETLEKRVRERTIELENVNQQLEKMSTTDALTNVRNRRFFDDYISREFALAQHDAANFSVFLLDIDHFKQVNDTYGHQAGDEILRCISGAISETIADSDSVARYGGEEFSVVLPGLDCYQVKNIADAIRMAVASINLDRIAPDFRVTISIGIYCAVPEQGDSHETWLSRADEALYKAKENGRNQVIEWEA
ncbi:sensor domain-containing diguanylate cyclase [Thalassolituus maritimus]|uniref:diguanylate cyclase n=1 Tax=Thalassolituus maritimus TaxID=484498 RepID=A0ABP9ZY95_9GAMM